MSRMQLQSSRYASCTPDVLEMCVRAVAREEDLGHVIPGFPGHHVALVARDVAEVLDAGNLERADPPGGDWLRTIIAEKHLAKVPQLWQRGKNAEAKAEGDRARDILEGVSTSSDRSPVLWYEDIYFEAVQGLLRRADRRALARQRECIAEVLRNPRQPNLLATMRDLAVVHLKLGDHREGLAMLAALLRHDTSDPWTFNAIAIDLPRLGFVTEGQLAAERGLDLVHRQGRDAPNGLAGQLTDLLREMRRIEARSDAPEDAREDLRDAIRTPFDITTTESSRELALRLVPELACARVKELPPMPTAAAIAETSARLRSRVSGMLSASEDTGPRWQAPVGGRTIRREMPKVGRNDSCPCGSGKKYKKCCA